jgi:hypothetical protein
MLFTLPKVARWNAERQVVEFGVEISEYRAGWSGCRGRVFQGLLPERPTPERCVAAYYIWRTQLESSPSAWFLNGFGFRIAFPLVRGGFLEYRLAISRTRGSIKAD